jgi:hypothetical protein
MVVLNTVLSAAALARDHGNYCSVNFRLAWLFIFNLRLSHSFTCADNLASCGHTGESQAFMEDCVHSTAEIKLSGFEYIKIIQKARQSSNRSIEFSLNKLPYKK